MRFLGAKELAFRRSLAAGTPLCQTSAPLGLAPIKKEEPVTIRQTTAALILASLITLIGPAFAGPFEDAGAAHARGDYATEYKLLVPLAKAGDSNAEYNLGVLYMKGLGVAKDPARALRWYRKAAAGGNALAKFGLGVMYATGVGVPQDYLEARMWFDLAVEGIPETDAKHATAVEYRDKAGAQLTGEQRADADKRARNWKPK